ncbi:hypothetical protein Peur_001144 [Populus x canadensis]
MHNSGWLIFKFSSELDMLAVLHGGHYHVFGRLLILKHMPDYFDFDTSDMIRLLVWVKFPNLPLQCWSPLCLSKLASVIGKPVHADPPTASMTRLSYARVLVEVDLLADLPSLINITLPNGVSISQEAVEKQSFREEPQGEPEVDPMAAEAAGAVEERVDCSVRKRAKMASQSRSPDVFADSPQVVLVSKDRLDTAATLPPRRQYLTRSKVSASAFGRSGLFRKIGASNNSSSADSRIQGGTVSIPSSSI